MGYMGSKYRRLESNLDTAGADPRVPRVFVYVLRHEITRHGSSKTMLSDNVFVQGATAGQ